jgi:hypothetical protein
MRTTLMLASSLAVATLLFSCSPSSGEARPSADEPQTRSGTDDVVVPRSRKGEVPRIDLSTPENVLTTIKDIIATDALDSLRQLCREGVSVGPPVLLMCGMATENMDQIDKFRNWFASARIDSAAILKGDTAALPLTLSPGHESMERHGFLVMVERDGLWYLNTLNWKQ